MNERLFQNIKKSRAAVSIKKLSDKKVSISKKLKSVLKLKENIINIINYAETNLADEPGKSKMCLQVWCQIPHYE